MLPSQYTGVATLAASVRAWRGQNVWRISFQEMQAAGANASWIAEFDGKSHVWAVFMEKISGLVNYYARLHLLRSHTCGTPWFDKLIHGQFGFRKRCTSGMIIRPNVCL